VEKWIRRRRCPRFWFDVDDGDGGVGVVDDDGGHGRWRPWTPRETTAAASKVNGGGERRRVERVGTPATGRWRWTMTTCLAARRVGGGGSRNRATELGRQGLWTVGFFGWG
jgi:hypothetical protein